MTKVNAIGRLFPAALFFMLFTLLAVLWPTDPVLMAGGVCIAAGSAAWLIVTIVEVARLMVVEPVRTVNAAA
jgi:hypothetical protein